MLSIAAPAEVRNSILEMLRAGNHGERICAEMGVGGRTAGSCAIVDRSSVYRVTSLLEGAVDDTIDPFIALADLATIVGAVIFDDRSDHGRPDRA